MRTKPSSWSLLWPKLTSERAMNDIVIISHTACMKLEKYSTTKSALEKGASVAPNESKFKKMLDEFNLLIAEEKDLVQQMPPTFPSSSTTPLATAALLFQVLLNLCSGNTSSIKSQKKWW
uniref:Uncharacterized protein n=1 Tax=Brassica campestris TaxID=3711 RepID=A0A3P6AWI7_BRACM|nr:unnamed protein product [Brassica rapa]